VPLRTRLDIGPHSGTSLFMPAFLDDEKETALAIKAVSVFPDNARRGIPVVNAAVLVLEPSTGMPVALVEGRSLTAIRTGAASGAATDLLSRKDSHVAAIIGAGTQGRTQLEAVCTVRRITTCRIYDIDTARAEAFISDMNSRGGPVPSDLRLARTPGQAVSGADIVCTSTTSMSPVFCDSDLKPGAHINGIGSYTSEMSEVPPETVARAIVVVDLREAALAEAGDIIKPILQGRFGPEMIHADLGEIVLGKKPGRSHEADLTFFKSVGIGVQDASAASLAFRNAMDMGLGCEVDL
jgi:ornithine cyclodeaminase